MNKLIYTIGMVFILSLGLSACGESDSDSAPLPDLSIEENSNPELGTIEKAEGVVYQDEIYANWPYN